MTDTRTALVIGGGIAGPVTAMALRRAGIEATVYEAHPETADGIGGALSIAPNGLNALAVLDADEAVRRISEPLTAMVLHSGTGRRLATLNSPSHLPTMRLVWRPDLYRALYDEATSRGIRIVHGRRLVGVTDSGPAVTAHFADGTTASADVLVGADGIRSTVRSLIDPSAPQPRYTGLISFGARMAATGLPSTRGEMIMVFGRRAFFGYQVNDDGSGGWFVNLPRREPMTRADARRTSAGQWLGVLAETFADDRVPATTLIRRTDPADLLIVGPMEDLPSVPTWHRGRVVLVGDAAHAPSSSSGQGASLAIESAVELARCLRDLPHQTAFPTYERLRRPRVERIIAMAARTNRDKAAGPVGRVLRDLLMPLVMKVARLERMNWQFEYRIDWDAPVGAAPVGAERPERVGA
ncbi:NAD(P)/FAD-dependent oxidoreductase [Micromonospora sp. HM5-17]|jgi:2-polyprenyl-6-methoxyphenol hydroxylase-like FAD-dependent oxidoreductase|uniref:FAD-dependent oxidoreductase n=1 Tax=Micromonospora sp. HM5-17 TaxID=2487710 RepID=UPI000F467F03|nr:NAD(P)/FAD-dependent oxidoreductase [Micromonospora sp. HM5-17]ROT32825.1 FAD-dependent monooxygenase [Micromonospora sp. HM5-17]